MILHSDFIGRKHVTAAFNGVHKKKKNEKLAALDRVRLETLAEGTAAQLLCVGPFSDEAPTIQRIHDFIHASGEELCGKLHEIYLSDPRGTAPGKLKTIIRQAMK